MVITLRVPAARTPVGLVVAACAAARLAQPDVRRFGAFMDVAIEVPPQSPAVYMTLLDALVRVNLWILRRWQLPPLYKAGVVYEREPKSVELWLCSLALYLLKIGDCEDLACHRVAELIIQGFRARVRLTYQEQEDGRLWHVTVDRPACYEDPSALLGM